MVFHTAFHKPLSFQLFFSITVSITVHRFDFLLMTIYVYLWLTQILLLRQSASLIPYCHVFRMPRHFMKTTSSFFTNVFNLHSFVRAILLKV